MLSHSFFGFRASYFPVSFLEQIMHGCFLSNTSSFEDRFTQQNRHDVCMCTSGLLLFEVRDEFRDRAVKDHRTSGVPTKSRPLGALGLDKL